MMAIKKRRGLRQEQRELARTMRGAGRTWVEIAAVFRDRYGLNARTALRLVRGWSQPDAANEWNQRWPDDPKTLKNISYWENWPSSTGREPSIPVLSKLAELYQCSISDLLIDGPDYRRLDAATGAGGDAPGGGGARRFLGEMAALDSLLDRLSEADVERVAGIALVWAQRLHPHGYASGVLMKLSAGLALAATAHSGLSRMPDPDADPAAVAPTPPLELRPWPTGVWLMEYADHETRVDLQLVLRRHRERVIGNSLPHPSGARGRLELTVDGMAVAGSWAAYAADGAPSYRTIRATLSPARETMHGRWIGFDEVRRVASGEWEMRYLMESVGGRALREYRAVAA